MNRRNFFTASTVAAVGAPALWPAEGQGLRPESVRKFVGSSHGSLDTVREMLKDEPTIVNAAWDWGLVESFPGDWETGLGAASHMGRRDIAELLLSHGARMDLFAAAMLGELKIIQAIAEAQPKYHETPGPHRIPLLTHAIFGKKEALDVFEFALESGADVNAATAQGGTPLMAAVATSQPWVVKALLANGADTAAKNRKGLTALDAAKRGGHTEMVELLESAGG